MKQRRRLTVRLPQSVRWRLSLAYAGLFLAAGAVLLAVTYGLVASSLSSTPQPQPVPSNRVVKLCKAKSFGTASPKGAKGAKGALAKCEAAFKAGARAGAANQRDATLSNLLLFSLVGLGAMTLVSGGIGWVMAGRVLRPVRRITKAAREASEQRLGDRLSMGGPRDELRELADTFDDMLGRLDAAFGAQRRFVANASHELRTPLTVMRTAIEVTLAKPARNPEQLEQMALRIASSINQAEALIEALLTLAQSNAATSRNEPVDLATAAEDALENVGARVRELDLALHLDLAPAELSGDRVLVERMVANLVDNATRYNVARGTVALRTGTTGGRPFVEVSNSGPFVAAEDVPSLFEPFRRLADRDGSVPGYGLGLSIVAAVAASHGASVVASGRSSGGLDVRVEFAPSSPGPVGSNGTSHAAKRPDAN